MHSILWPQNIYRQNTDRYKVYIENTGRKYIDTIIRKR